jgi:hypothetical protein
LPLLAEDALLELLSGAFLLLDLGASSSSSLSLKFREKLSSEFKRDAVRVVLKKSNCDAGDCVPFSACRWMTHLDHLEESIVHQVAKEAAALILHAKAAGR